MRLTTVSNELREERSEGWKAHKVIVKIVVVMKNGVVETVWRMRERTE